uniref:RNA polymerase II elongation factor ELL-like n=1 Tax=Echeneis naucrates TaxID=173247 RepID=A0A665U7T9_ECHNA
MSALREEQSYGLSGGELRRGGNVSVFHVKLTDSAARAIGSFQNGKGWSSQPTICFSANQGKITIPCSEKKDDIRIFTFGVTNVARDNPHGSFDCVQQLTTGAADELSCLGVIQKKMTVNATDDSYDKARQSMAQAEEETRSRGAIVIKHGGRYQGKKVTVRAPAPALAGDSVSNKRSVGDVQGRPLRERLTHLLALRPYKRPELILRLQKDGLSAGDNDLLDSVLMEVGQLNSRDNTFVLKDGVYKELQKDWPGYSSGDQQLLKRILVRRLFQPQQNLLTVPEAQVSPLRETPNSSPAHRPRHSLPEEYTDPLASKKPRISHMSRKTAIDKSRLRPTEQMAHKDAAGDDRKRNSLDPRKLLDSLSEVCQQEEAMAERLEPTLCAQEECVSLFCLHRKYTVICSQDQRQHYKQDFNKEYSEYRDLHAHIDSVTRQFMKLDTQRKRLHQQSHKYKTVHDQILKEYRKIKKSNPNYNQDKIRCEYLHNKLAHIKKLISEYDQKQLRVEQSCPN